MTIHGFWCFVSFLNLWLSRHRTTMFYFFGNFHLELVCQAMLGSLKISTLKGLIYSNVVRVALMVMTMFFVQMYYGPLFPYHLVSTFKILLLSRHIFFRLSLMALCGGLVVLCSCVSLFCSYLLERHEMGENENCLLLPSV